MCVRLPLCVAISNDANEKSSGRWKGFPKNLHLNVNYKVAYADLAELYYLHQSSGYLFCKLCHRMRATKTLLNNSLLLALELKGNYTTRKLT